MKDFSSLAGQWLQLADSGIPLVDFLREVTRRLLDFSECDEVEMSVTRKGRRFRCRYDRRRDRFRMETVAAAASRQAGDPAGGLTFPLTAADEKMGWLLLKRRRKRPLAPDEIESYRKAANTLGAALKSHLTHAALRERVKELTCLYNVAQLAERSEESPFGELLQGIAETLPPAWQYPEITAGRITLDGKSYEAGDSRKPIDRQSAPIRIAGRRRGAVEVAYVESRPELDEGPFLREERNLIDAVARQIALIAERRQAAEEKTRLQDQLRHADRLATIGQLAAGVAHELNEPLGNILAFAQLGEKEPGLAQQMQKDLQKIVMASLHAREIIKKLMLFARQTPPQKLAVNLNDVVEEGLSFLEARCAKAGIVVKRRFSRRLPRIVADPSQLHQALVNLVVNAIHAMPNGGACTIATRASKEFVSLVVEDNGVGMSEDVLAKIFIPFFTTKDVNEGTGLGLSVVHGIVKSHGGAISVRSAPGEGTRFEIRLPLVAPETNEKEHSDGEPA